MSQTERRSDSELATSRSHVAWAIGYVGVETVGTVRLTLTDAVDAFCFMYDRMRATMLEAVDRAKSVRV